jgi:hypothetical protein
MSVKYIWSWSWSINSDCSVRSGDGDPFVLKNNWGSSPAYLQIGVAIPFGCADWRSIDVRLIGSPAAGSILVRPMPRLFRNKRSHCKPAVPHGQCAQINTEAEAGLYLFETVVDNANGQSMRSELRLDYRP